MPEKEPQNATWLVQAIPFLFAVALSCLGGIVNYLNRIDKTGATFSFVRLMIEITTSGFVGIVSFMLCDAADFGWSYTAAIVAISGHMGTRALFLFENMAMLPLLRRYGYGAADSEAKTGRKKQGSKDAEKPNERV